MALRVDVEVGQAVRIGDSIVIVEDKNGRRARLRIESDEDVTVEPKPADDVGTRFKGGQLVRRLASG